ncbi:DNA internalization-related competence protein ComEC/Rec2 [Neptunomonas sp.]|uniref:DNA internalization-related competence protein ComEC/Rec2 n=1 Tax=Neptunomonas sp. TaxID=1971898 RepID=UPI003566BF87
MIIYITAFAIVAWLPVLPPLIWLSPLPVLGLIIFRYFPAGRVRLLSFFIGLVIALLYGHFQLMHRWSVDDAKVLWRVAGVVEGLPQHEGKQVRFSLRVNNIQSESSGGLASELPVESSSQLSGQPKHQPRIIRLSWYRADRHIQPGDRLVLDVKLRPAHSFWNPGGFDYERWTLSRNIDAVGYVKVFLEQQVASSSSIDLIRFRLITWLAGRFSEEPVVSSTLQALLIGDKNALREWQWRLMRNTGTTHLMVVSGLHIGVCVGLGWWLGRLLFVGLFRGREHSVAHQWLPVIAALGLSGLYVGLAGFSIPTQRAWVMAAVLLGAQLLMRRPDVWARWWLAMAVVLTLQPLAIHEIGFWLSFSAVAALLFLVTIRQVKAPLMILLKSQWWILWILSPLLLLFFGQMSMSSPLVNMLAIPFLSLLLMLTMPALLMESIGIQWGLDVVGVLIQGLWASLAWVDGLSDQWVLDLQPPGIVSVVFAGLGAVMILQPVSSKLKLVGVLCWLPVFMPPPDSIESGRFKAVVFDVGQGTSVLIRTHQHVMLYDTGAAYANGSNAFERAVMPYLKQQGVNYLDKLIVSHDDNDHAGGVSIVSQTLGIGVTQSGMPAALPIPAEFCKPGMTWSWDGIEFAYIHPEPATNATDNDRSCVLEVRSSQCSLLITGDAGLKVETQLAESLSPVSWLVAGHHGSRTSTGDTLLDAAKPDSVLVSAGFLNRYGHPHADVVSRIKAHGSRIIRTDKKGAVLLEDAGEAGCRLETWRQKEKRYWSAS